MVEWRLASMNGFSIAEELADEAEVTNVLLVDVKVSDEEADDDTIPLLLLLLFVSALLDNWTGTELKLKLVATPLKFWW